MNRDRASNALELIDQRREEIVDEGCFVEISDEVAFQLEQIADQLGTILADLRKVTA